MSKGSPVIHVRVDATSYRRLCGYAAATRQSVTQVLREAIALYLLYEDVPMYSPPPPNGQIGIDDVRDMRK